MAVVRFVGPIDQPVYSVRNYSELQHNLKLVDDNVVDWLVQEFDDRDKSLNVKEFEDRIVVDVSYVSGNDATFTYHKGDYITSVSGSPPQSVPRQAMINLTRILKAKHLFLWVTKKAEVALVAPKNFYWHTRARRFKVDFWCSMSELDCKEFYLLNQKHNVQDNCIFYDDQYKLTIQTTYKGFYDALFIDAYSMASFLGAFNEPDVFNKYIKLLETFYE